MQSAELFLKSRGQYISRVLLTVGFLVLYVERDDLALSVEGVPPRQVRRPRGEPCDGEALRHFGHLLHDGVSLFSAPFLDSNFYIFFETRLI